ncbi:MAG: hypothetical protein R3F17_09025 [Planctomycetota bacterium]
MTSFTCTAPSWHLPVASGASAGVMRNVLGMGVFGLSAALLFVPLSLLPGKTPGHAQAAVAGEHPEGVCAQGALRRR